MQQYVEIGTPYYRNLVEKAAMLDFLLTHTMETMDRCDEKYQMDFIRGTFKGYADRVAALEKEEGYKP